MKTALMKKFVYRNHYFSLLFSFLLYFSCCYRAGFEKYCRNSINGIETTINQWQPLRNFMFSWCMKYHDKFITHQRIETFWYWQYYGYSAANYKLIYLTFKNTSTILHVLQQKNTRKNIVNYLLHKQ